MKYTVALLLTSICITAQAAEKELAQPIEMQMSEDEFSASGLGKLTPRELEFLNQWLINNQSNSARVVDTKSIVPTPQKQEIEQKSVEQAYQEAKQAREAPRTLQIKGEFSGWSGGTYFVMTNGEIWKQRTSSRYKKKLDSPKVKIYKNKFGFFELEVIETGKKVGVKRHQKK